MDKDTLYISHIRDAIALIEEYMHDISQETLATKPMVRDAVVHEIQIIGEAVKKISTETTNRFPDIDWQNIARMRDRIVHHYFDIDTSVVWGVVVRDIPELKKVILHYLEEEKDLH